VVATSAEWRESLVTLLVSTVKPTTSSVPCIASIASIGPVQRRFRRLLCVEACGGTSGADESVTTTVRIQHGVVDRVPLARFRCFDRASPHRGSRLSRTGWPSMSNRSGDSMLVINAAHGRIGARLTGQSSTEQPDPGRNQPCIDRRLRCVGDDMVSVFGSPGRKVCSCASA
jgi:hypothetical protein